MSTNQYSPSSSSQSLAALPGLFSLRARAWAAWKRHRNERALESLSYDTLKDIGFPSVDDAVHKTEQ
ncbi:hypothetical protein AU381_16490 [Sinorhizobium glycinis]|uniref:DUF1127 domain-containing protein n=1 Tax=Sinorhizobium glycinis TaxID=1472378 RepID=A0A178Y5A9_9HYPH|nr:hypothetical protein [Sinorhizobium glycinis]OAP42759.1 hypothetical protein AU381_16490 [Sinorhizobium glycinis]